MLRAYALTKRFRPDVDALIDVSFDVADGELCALVGHNGAGKTTSMNCFLDFVRPDRGHADVDGIVVARSPVEARRRIAFLSEHVAVYRALTGRENLRFFVRLAGRSRLTSVEAGDALVRVGLAERALDMPVATYSKGMRQRVGLAIAAACGVRNLILDEPTTGLDPDAASELMTLLRELRDDGRAILTCSHDLARLGPVADAAICLAHGRVVATARRDALGALGELGLETWYGTHVEAPFAEPRVA